MILIRETPVPLTPIWPSECRHQVRSYFMFHSLDPQQPAHVFRHLPLLQFVEASIYLLDERNERALSGRLASTAAPAAAPASDTLLPKGTHAPLRSPLVACMCVQWQTQATTRGSPPDGFSFAW